MIESKYTKIVTVYRNSWTEDEDNYFASEETEVGTIKGHLQQASPQDLENAQLNFTVGYTLWCSPTSDIKVGDRVEIDSESYSVRLLQDNSFIGSNKHYELVLEKEAEQNVGS
jgi:hypothetical protein